jgi:hypothetical protein
LVRLTVFVKSKNIGIIAQIFPISYVAAWSMVKKAGKLGATSNCDLMISGDMQPRLPQDLGLP